MKPLMRLARCLAAGLAALWLAACGPSGGGTGTGESVVQLSDYGARAASSCSAPFAGSLDCDVVAGATVDAAALPGTAAADFAGPAPDLPRLHLFANRAELQLFCGRARFEGEWGVRSDGVAAYFGLWSVDANPRRALMRAQALPSGGLVLDVFEVDSGQLLVGRVAVQRVSAPPPGC
ncbi:MAG: hypothetical protein U1F56_21740 [Rubrivivax sp.]